jgi:hypothetical protein
VQAPAAEHVTLPQLPDVKLTTDRTSPSGSASFARTFTVPTPPSRTPSVSVNATGASLEATATKFAIESKPPKKPTLNAIMLPEIPRP